MWESQPCWVTSTCGANARTTGGTTRVERPQPPRVGSTRRESDIDGGALRLRAAGVAREAGAGEEHLPGLVQRDRQHPRVVVEDRLDAVAVVDVDIDVRDPLDALVEQPLDAHRDVVVDAEPARPVAHGVVQAARDVGAVQALAGVHLAERLEAGADDVRGRAMHVDEHRVVVGREAVVVDLDRVGVLARAGDRVDQPLVVDRRDLPVVGERRRHHLQPVEHAEVAGQPHGQVDADRGHRVRGTEVVRRE